MTGKHVLIFAGGGLSPVSGGVGRLLRYLMDEWAHMPGMLPVRVVDTRGAGGAGTALWRFAAAAGLLVVGHLRGQVACAHIHMTTRGSAWRKAALCAACRILGVPVVLHLHGADFFEFHAALPAPARRGLRAAMAGAGTVVVIGAQWRRRLVAELGMPAARVRVVLNGVPAAPRTLPAPGPPLILFLGRIGARKGVGELIAALASPAMVKRDWTAVIAGDGGSAPYRAQVAAAGLGHRVALPGWQDATQTASLLGQAALLVLPSHHEVMPMAVIEAMARGVPIVATPVGSVAEILQHGVSARLVSPGMVEQLADALAALLDSPQERARLAEGALATFRARLDVARTAAHIQALYREAAATASGGEFVAVDAEAAL